MKRCRLTQQGALSRHHRWFIQWGDWARGMEVCCCLEVPQLAHLKVARHGHVVHWVAMSGCEATQATRLCNGTSLWHQWIRRTGSDGVYAPILSGPEALCDVPHNALLHAMYHMMRCALTIQPYSTHMDSFCREHK